MLQSCNKSFNLMKKRRICRQCGNCFCNKCSPRDIKYPGSKNQKPICLGKSLQGFYSFDCTGSDLGTQTQFEQCIFGLSTDCDADRNEATQAAHQQIRATQEQLRLALDVSINKFITKISYLSSMFSLLQLRFQLLNFIL